MLALLLNLGFAGGSAVGALEATGALTSKVTSVPGDALDITPRTDAWVFSLATVRGEIVTFEIKRGNLKPAFEAILQSNRAPVDLTNASSVRLIMVSRKGGPPKVDAPGSFYADRTSGKVSYAWAEGDTNVEDDYDAEWKVTWVDGKPQSFPGGGKYLHIRVVKNLG